MQRLEQLGTKGKYLFLAYDHGLVHGPADFNERSLDPDFALEIGLKGGYNAIVLQRGTAEKHWKVSKFQKLPLILKLNGKSALPGGEPVSLSNCSVDFAKRLGASAVGYTIYLGSEYEHKMVREFGRIVEEAHRIGLPVIAWMYPRGKAVSNETSPETVAYAARAGMELGADMVKIKYSGSKESFSFAVKAAGKTKVVLSGGPQTDDEEFLRMVGEAMKAGADGVAVGRNVWQNKDPLALTEKLKKLIFNQ